MMSDDKSRSKPRARASGIGLSPFGLSRLRRLIALRFDPSRVAISRLFRRKPKPSGGYVHIHAPPAGLKSLTVDRCPDCKQNTVFVGYHYEWYGWDETCVRCGRRWSDGEWCELDFSRTARIDNIKSAVKLWDRYPDAELIHRVKVRPACDSDAASGGDREDGLQSEGPAARAEGIAQDPSEDHSQ